MWQSLICLWSLQCHVCDSHWSVSGVCSVMFMTVTDLSTTDSRDRCDSHWSVSGVSSVMFVTVTDLSTTDSRDRSVTVFINMTLQTPETDVTVTDLSLESAASCLWQSLICLWSLQRHVDEDSHWSVYYRLQRQMWQSLICLWSLQCHVSVTVTNMTWSL